MHPQRLVSIVLAALVVAACAPKAPPTGTAGPRSASVKPVVAAGSPTPAPADVKPASVASPQTPLAPSLAPAVAATLIGKVKVPAGLISENGLGVISENGVGVISENGVGVVSNNGAGYRLNAVEQVPIRGAVVRLLDAAGQPVLVAGTPLTATTGADGQYAFTAALPERNLVLEVSLPEGKGTFQAIAPANPEARKSTDVDLVATLTTGYILDKYVRAQADPLAVLEKLPADVERTTRDKAQAALAAGAVTLPAVYEPRAVVAAVEALRKADKSLDEQLEVVKRLLVAAGLSDLGNGRAADQTGLRVLTSVVATPDGRVYFTCRMDERVWTIGPTGLLEAAIGRGPGNGDRSVTGKAPTEVQLRDTGGLAVAPDGALLVWERDRVLRYDARKQLSVVTAELPSLLGLIATAEGIYALNWGGRLGVGADAKPVAGGVWKLEAAGPRHIGTIDVAGGLLGATRKFVAAAPGHATLVMNSSKGPDRRDLNLANAAIGAEKIEKANTGTAIDDRGGTWKFDGTAKTYALDGAGTTVKADAAFAPADYPPCFRLADGGILVAREGTLFRCDSQEARRIAGLGAPFTEGPASEVPFEDPDNMAIDSTGALRVFDRANAKLWSVVPEGRGKLVATLPLGFKGDFPVFGEPGRTFKVAGFYPQRLAATADGATWLLNVFEPYVLRIATDGTTTVGFAMAADVAPDAYWFNDFAVSDDGAVIALLEDRKTWQATIERRKPGQPPERMVVPFRGETAPQRFSIAPDGTYVLADARYLMKWRWGDPAVDLLVALDSKPNADWHGNYDIRDERLTATAGDQLYGNNDASIWRFDLKTLKITTIVGEDGYLVQGGTVDTGTAGQVYAPTFDAAGDLYFLDPGNRQVKRIPAAQLLK